MTVEEISERLDEIKHIMPPENTDSKHKTSDKNAKKKILAIR